MSSDFYEWPIQNDFEMLQQDEVYRLQMSNEIYTAATGLQLRLVVIHKSERGSRATLAPARERIMLAKLLEERMNKERLSSRAVAKETGVAHTTIISILKGRKVDLSVLTNVANWLGVNLGSVLTSEQGLDEKDTLAAEIAVIIETRPELANVFREVIQDVKNGKLEPDDLQAIIEYANFKISSKRRGNS